MKDYTKFDTQAGVQTQAQSQVGFDAGLRGFMIKIYNYMALALLVSGGAAYFAGTSEAFISTIAANPVLMWVVMLAPLGLVLFFSFRIHRLQLQTAQILFWVYSVAVGLSLFWIFAAYTQTSIVKAFAITAATFASMSLYGYTTKRDLTSIGQFMIMGLFGLIIAMLVNLFLQSSALEFAISIIAVVVFVGLIAYDTQKLKSWYYQAASNTELLGKYALMGALNLYLDFINLFIHILRFVGDRR